MLIEPQADTLYRMTTTHHTHTLHSARLLDTSVDELRRQLRQRLELVEPVIVTGHQAEFCHAGVFAKTIAADALAVKSDGSRVFLTVDTDVPKATRLAVPYVERGEVRRAFVPIPGGDPQLAMEWQPRVPVAWWRDFFERVAKLAGGDDTLLRSYADGVFSGQRDTLDVNGAMQQGYAAVEQSLGLAGTANVRTSQLSATPEFRAFVAHLMQNAAGFAEHYNAAQRAYRSRRHERNPRRPAPLLALNGDRVELPFWVGRARQPRRRLSVAAGNEFVELFADDEPIGCEPLSRLRHAANLAGGFRIEAEGWHLRPRALTLSAFARLFLSDTFVHGIGGAKYDEMTEDFVRRFFGVELPPTCCVTATAHLPLPRQGVGLEALAAVRHARHDLLFNPQRHLHDLPQDLRRRREELIGTSRALRRERRADHTARRRTFDEIRAVNHELLCHDPDQAAALEGDWRRVEQRWRSDRLALDREYFFALHPRHTMEELIRRIRAALG